jgi:hypothetical protein
MATPAAVQWHRTGTVDEVCTSAAAWRAVWGEVCMIGRAVLLLSLAPVWQLPVVPMLAPILPHRCVIAIYGMHRHMGLMLRPGQLPEGLLQECCYM